MHTYKHSGTHIWDLFLSKNWSVMPPCSSGPLHLCVSGRPKAFKCFKLIITLMLSLPLWAPCLSVRKWNAIEIDREDTGCSDILGVAGDLTSVKALRRVQRENRLPGRVTLWQGKLGSGNSNTAVVLVNTQEHNTHWAPYFALFSFCTLACYVVGDVSIFENMGIENKNADPLPQCIAGNTKHTNKKQPPTTFPLTTNPLMP